MDAFTLVVVSALAATIMTCSMGLLYLAGSRQACLLDWTVTGALLLVNNLLGIAAIKLHASHFLIPGIANALYIAGHYGILAGLRRHFGLPTGWKLLLSCVALVPFLHALPLMRESVVYRLLVLTPVIASINLAVMLTLWRHVRRDQRAAYLPLFVVELVFMLQLCARTAYLLASEGQTLTFLGSQFLQTSGSLFVLIFLSVATMSCALIVLHQQAQALRRVSVTDALTGWLNRRAMNELAAREFRRCHTAADELFFITFDIDHFKSINDRHGHDVGDAALRHVTSLAAGAVRGNDALFRIGGEEFAVLVSGADAAHVHDIAERLRERIAAMPLGVDGATVPMTVSVGVARMDARDERWEQVLQRADKALYRAKEQGRNRVVVHAPGSLAWVPAAARSA